MSCLGPVSCSEMLALFLQSQLDSFHQSRRYLKICYRAEKFRASVECPYNLITTVKKTWLFGAVWCAHLEFSRLDLWEGGQGGRGLIRDILDS